MTLINRRRPPKGLTAARRNSRGFFRRLPSDDPPRFKQAEAQGASFLRLKMATPKMLSWWITTRRRQDHAHEEPRPPRAHRAAGMSGTARPQRHRRGQSAWRHAAGDEHVFNEKSAISPEMAIRLSKAFGSTPDTGVKMQAAFDLAVALRSENKIHVERYKPRPERELMTPEEIGGHYLSLAFKVACRERHSRYFLNRSCSSTIRRSSPQVAAARLSVGALEWNLVLPDAWLADVEGLAARRPGEVWQVLGTGFELDPEVMRRHRPV